MKLKLIKLFELKGSDYESVGDRAYEAMMPPIDTVASFSKTTLVIMLIIAAESDETYFVKDK